MDQIIQSFQINYQGQADFQISFAVQGESQCKDVLLGGLEDGADVFTFADDQLHRLTRLEALYFQKKNIHTMRRTSPW